MANNMTIEDSVQNWEENGILSGGVNIELLDGTSISITQSICAETKKIISTSMTMHRAQNMNIALFGIKANEFTKRTVNYKGSTWTEVAPKGE